VVRIDTKITNSIPDFDDVRTETKNPRLPRAGREVIGESGMINPMFWEWFTMVLSLYKVYD